jgi:hypothetical protein
MAQKHLEQVLTAGGLTPDQVKAIVDLKDDATDFKAEDQIAPILTSVETRIKNDPKFYEGINETNLPKEFLRKLEGAQYGRSATEVRKNVIANLGLNEADFAGDEFKPLDKFLPAVLAKITSGKLTDKDLQQKLVEANTKLAQMEADLPNVEKRHKDAAEERISNMTFDLQVMTTLGSVPGLKVGAAVISDKIAAMIKSKYAFEIVGGIAEPRQKDKPTLAAMSTDGKKILTLKDVVEETAKSLDVIDPEWDKKKKTVQQNGKTTLDVDPEAGKGFKVSPHVKGKIEKQIEKEKEA